MRAQAILFRSTSLAAAGALVFFISKYPLGAAAPALVAAVYAAVLWQRPHWWLYVLPCLLPVMSLYPWTGWLYVEEFDLLVLTTLAVGYWRASTHPPEFRLTPLASFTLALLAISYFASAVISARNVEAWEWTALVSYNTPINGLRILKGFAWPLLLLPLLLRAAGDPAFDYRQALARGMVAGAAAASAVVVWERSAYPGLLNFASDYRAIGPFYEAHVGGAALDGYLALTLPFCVAWLLASRTLKSAAASTTLLGLAMYATFATFSRGLYASLAAAGLTVAALAFKTNSESRFRLILLGVATAVCGLLFAQVFSSGGYRSFAAVLGVYAAAFYFGGIPGQLRWRWTVPPLIVLAVTTVLVTLYLPKGAYFCYGLALIATAAFALRERLGMDRRLEPLAASIAWLALSAAAVGWHWNGIPATQDAAIAVVVAGLLAFYNRRASRSLWILDRGTATWIAAGLLSLGIAIPVVANYYVKTRLQAVSKDFEIRKSHWDQSIALLPDGPLHLLLGAGLGRYPELYFWHNRKGEFPGSARIEQAEGRSFLRLGGARNSPEIIRFSQRIDISSGPLLHVEISYRGTTPKSMLHVDVCEKWLIYTERCSGKPARFQSTEGTWSRQTAVLDTQRLGSRSAFSLTPTTLILAVDRDGVFFDIDSISVTDSAGRELVANGQFGNADRWFFTSDLSHLPWHAKNLWLGIWFDQGWMGLIAFLAFTAVAVVSATRLALSKSPFGTALLAGIVAFFVVALFDTLLDSTRLAALFYLLCMSAAIVPRALRARAASRGTRSGSARRRARESHARVDGLREARSQQRIGDEVFPPGTHAGREAGARGTEQV